MKQINMVEAAHLKKDLPELRVGSAVRVHVKIREEDKVRIQVFEGTLIRKRGRGTNLTFTVRKVSYGEGLERTFPLNSPSVDKIEVISKGRVRRAKLYYLRKKIGKKTKIAQ
ncbi:50S ribosomal protein L19 [Candidatus Omnitrophota bacterium]